MNQKVRIALLEDEENAARLVMAWLTEAGYEVDWYSRGADCARAVERGQYQVCLLDWMVPDLPGPDVMARLQMHCHGAVPPVIFLSGRDAEDDIAQMLQAGADDYVVKPASRPVLLARLQAVLRRLGQSPGQRKERWGDLEVDFGARVFFQAGQRVVLTDRETDFAIYLFQNIGRLLTRSHLMLTVWGHGDTLESRKVDVHASALRRKLQLLPEHGWRLVSVYSQGYRLEWLQEQR